MQPILILYASQTGTAEELAKDLHHLMNEINIKNIYHDVYDCELDILKKHSVCLLLMHATAERWFALLPESTMARISKIKELFKNARTMAEKQALAKMLAKNSAI